MQANGARTTANIIKVDHFSPHSAIRSPLKQASKIKLKDKVKVVNNMLAVMPHNQPPVPEDDDHSVNLSLESIRKNLR